LNEKENKIIFGETGLEKIGQMMKILKEKYFWQYYGKKNSKNVKELLA